MSRGPEAGDDGPRLRGKKRPRGEGEGVEAEGDVALERQGMDVSESRVKVRGEDRRVPRECRTRGEMLCGLAVGRGLRGADPGPMFPLGEREGTRVGLTRLLT